MSNADDGGLPPEIQKALRAQARKHLTIATDHATQFGSNVRKDLTAIGVPMGSVLAVLAAVTCDLLAEALVYLDHSGTQSLDSAIPMFTQRLSEGINLAQDKVGKIEIAKRFPPSSN